MWIIITLVASLLQTLRNSFQRELTQKAGVWAGTWVRFAFGVPITFLALLLVVFLRGSFTLNVGFYYYIMCFTGAVAQVVATAALLASMERSSFAIGITFNNSSVILTALYGVAFLGDHLKIWAWVGIIISTIGIIIASLPKMGGKGTSLKKLDWKDASIAAAYGILSGGLFAISTNSYRVAVNLVEHNPNFYSSIITVLIVQLMQTILLGAIMFILQRRQLKMALGDWKSSLNAGWAGASGSILWFVALGLMPAAMVRVVNLIIEMPVSILMGWLKFKEKLGFSKIAAIALIVAGVIMAIIGR